MQQVTNLPIVSTHITEVRLFENKEHILAPAVFHNPSALKQPVSGFHRTQTCVSTTSAAFSKCYGNPPFKNTQLTRANMAGIMATCGYNWASREPGGWASIYKLLTPGIIPVPLVVPHTHGFTGCENVVFSLQSAKKGAFYLINENGQALTGFKWTTLKRLEHFQTDLWTRDNSKCWLSSVQLMK